MPPTPRRNIFEFNHMDTTLPKGTIEMLKDLYAYYHKKHYGYEKLYRSFQRKKSVLQYCGWQSCDNFSDCRGHYFEPNCVRFFDWFCFIVKAVASFKKYDKTL